MLLVRRLTGFSCVLFREHSYRFAHARQWVSVSLGGYSERRPTLRRCQMFDECSECIVRARTDYVQVIRRSSSGCRLIIRRLSVAHPFAASYPSRILRLAIVVFPLKRSCGQPSRCRRRSNYARSLVGIDQTPFER